MFASLLGLHSETALGAGICYNFVLRLIIGAELYDYAFWKTGTDTP